MGVAVVAGVAVVTVEGVEGRWVAREAAAARARVLVRFAVGLAV